MDSKYAGHSLIMMIHNVTMIYYSVIDLQLRGYNGRNTAQCSPDHLGVLAKLCPLIERMHLGLTWPESFLFLSRFRNISHLSVFRVASVENFDLPLMVKPEKTMDFNRTS